MIDHYVPEMDGSAIKTIITINYSMASFPTNSSVPEKQLGYYTCNQFLYGTINNTVRICDVILIIPNTLFLVFLCYKLGGAHVRMALVPCPIVKSFYTMVVLVCVIGVIRCFVSMLLTANFLRIKGDALGLKILWLILRCFLLAVELSVIIFGLCAGHLDGRSSVRRVLCMTSFCAVAFSSLQAGLEIARPGHRSIFDRDYHIFTHGGMVFWFTSSLFFSLIYFVITMLPCTAVRERYMLPSKRSFYVYCGFLGFVNFIQATGSALLYYREPFGLCIVDSTMFVYYALFAPLVYWTFLADFFRSRSGYVLVSTNYAIRSSAPYQTFSEHVMPNSGGYEDLPGDVTHA